MDAQDEFEDINGVIRIRKSKDKQHDLINSIYNKTIMVNNITNA